jgi:5-methylcytosine-specific restriction endonuclease McrA
MKNTPRRFFTNREARKLYILSNGKCTRCGKDIEDYFEVDHIIPFSKGGKTEISNGQVLFMTCNRKKGASMINPKAYNPEVSKKYKPRKWQERFAEEVLKKYQTGARDFLCEAVPAGGKTFGSLRIASMMLD